jgi:Xaa-Pro aminopeptidase
MPTDTPLNLTPEEIAEFQRLNAALNAAFCRIMAPKRKRGETKLQKAQRLNKERLRKRWAERKANEHND